jgi:molybdopterin-synthase adenylyltransferase
LPPFPADTGINPMAKSPKRKPVTIRFTARCFERVRKHLLRDEFEEICFLFCHVVETQSPSRLIFLADYVVTLDPACYLRRTRTSIVVDSRAKNALYSRFVESPYNGLINIHSHPFSHGATTFSPKDDTDDYFELAWQYEQLPRGKRSLGQKEVVYVASMVFGQNTFDARGYSHSPSSPPTLPTIKEVQVLGETFRILTPTGGTAIPPLSYDARRTYDRQIMAFGEEGQRALAHLRVCLVGAGGIGSITGENLSRQGIRSLALIDPDYLGLSNLNRWQGAHPHDVGKLKVRILAKRLKAMFPTIQITPVASSLASAKALKALKSYDVIVGAVDNHLTRFILNRLSVQYLIPYLDAATVIKKGEGDNQMELLARLAVVVPGTTACLSCSRIKHYDHEEIAPHLYDPQTRIQLMVSGYIQDHPEVASPAVMPLNMLASSMLLTELQNLVTGFHPLARSVAMDYLRPNRRTVRSDSDNFPEGPSPDCLSCAGFLGTGDSEPLPTVDTRHYTAGRLKKVFSLPVPTV